MKGAAEAETIKAPTTALTSERFETVAEAKRLLQEAARQIGSGNIPPELQSLIDRLNPFDDTDDASNIPGLFESPISFETIEQLKDALEKYDTAADRTRTIDLGNTGQASETTSSLASKILEAIRNLNSNDEDEPSKTAKSSVGS
jgi:hypothetical protein